MNTTAVNQVTVEIISLQPSTVDPEGLIFSFKSANGDLTQELSVNK